MSYFEIEKTCHGFVQNNGSEMIEFLLIE